MQPRTRTGVLVVMRIMPNIMVVMPRRGACSAYGEPRTGGPLATAVFVAKLCKALPKFTDGAALNSLTYLRHIVILETSRLGEVEEPVKSAT